MSKTFRFEAGTSIHEFRKHILGMLVGVASQGCECFQLAHSFQPYAERSSEMAPPALGSENKLQAIENEVVQDAYKKVMRRFEKLHPAIEFGDGLRSRNSLSFEPSLQLE